MATSFQTRSRVMPLHQSPQARPTTVPAVFRAAARIIAANGLWQGDYVPDPFDREMCIPHALRPMSIVAALKCAVSGDPHTWSMLADEAIGVLALRLNDGPEYGDIDSLEEHVDAWGDAEGRTTESAVAVLEAAADANEVAS
ncbi:hypothetical protein CFC35_05435 [Streptomyces sp. FBKL.4005]|uniref:DUF6197 family protein n=1 Tax=Streptomyces sp. FBKL.4005 TaxID=2015515 RepID=UPI000B9691F9|nr:hypothetical protein [Streptomyces sp. FBKL.4005]OYP14007.1 hypothetical protein CFC35_05435 [Streptomyces sp. FBKL.4005]